MWANCSASMKRWWASTRPANARSNSGSFSRSRPLASWANSAASVCPATSAAKISRPDLPRMSVATVASLMLAPSSVFCSRFAAAVRSRTRLVR
jgi:hypothetical protein